MCELPSCGTVAPTMCERASVREQHLKREQYSLYSQPATAMRAVKSAAAPGGLLTTVWHDWYTAALQQVAPIIHLQCDTPVDTQLMLKGVRLCC
jgi:hypothetical protein